KNCCRVQYRWKISLITGDDSFIAGKSTAKEALSPFGRFAILAALAIPKSSRERDRRDSICRCCLREN
ncbi:MAG: hypothetical protein ABI407_14905, partial [Bradyrhizobium sp.]